MTSRSVIVVPCQHCGKPQERDACRTFLKATCFDCKRERRPAQRPKKAFGARLQEPRSAEPVLDKELQDG